MARIYCNFEGGVIRTQDLYYRKRLGLQASDIETKTSLQITCPLCGTPDMFSVNLSADSWSCSSCSKTGNSYDLEKLLSGTSGEDTFALVAQAITEVQTELGRARGTDAYRYENSEYYYTDLFGKKILLVVRSNRWYDGKELTAAPFLVMADGSFVANPAKPPEILYNLPDVVKADVVVITESELAANAINKAFDDAPGKWVATCWPLAIGDWPESCSRYLLDKPVFLVPENLEASRYRLARAADALVRVAASVRMVIYPELGSVIDLTDFIDKCPSPANELQAAFDAGMLWTADDDFVIISAGELLENTDLERRWIVDGLLPVGGIGLLVGGPKVGKSTLARQLAVAVADGQEFLGRNVTPGVALYVAMEGTRGEIKEHLGKLGLQNVGNVRICLGKMPSPAQLARTIKQYAVSLVIFDTLAKCLAINALNHYGSVLKALQTVEHLARDLGAHLLFIHHTTGDGEALGSKAITGGPDVNIYLERKGDGNDRLITTRQRGGVPFNRTVLEFDLDSESYSLK